MLTKIKNGVQVLIGSTIGIYIGTLLFSWLDYNNSIRLNITQSAPWYAGIILPTLIAAAILAVEVACFYYLKHKIKKVNQQG